MSAEFGWRWYVAQAHPHAEANASPHLPICRAILGNAARQAHPSRRRCFRGTSSWRLIWHPTMVFGVTRLVRGGDRPAPVLLKVVDALERSEDTNGYVSLDPRPGFSPGDKIRVVGGAFCVGCVKG